MSFSVDYVARYAHKHIEILLKYIEIVTLVEATGPIKRALAVTLGHI